jgi:hypothetical protein
MHGWIASREGIAGGKLAAKLHGESILACIYIYNSNIILLILKGKIKPCEESAASLI